MAQDYLLKTEPSEYSFADLQRDKVTIWDGVSNPVALKHLREMEPDPAWLFTKRETTRARSAQRRWFPLTPPILEIPR